MEATANTSIDGKPPHRHAVAVRRSVPATEANSTDSPPLTGHEDRPRDAVSDNAATANVKSTVPWLVLTVVFCGVLFALLHNPYWSPGGDSEVYTAVARSLVKGEGYQFNGAPYALSPPGWPVVLAGLMWVSPTFAFLKAAQIVMMVGALGLFFQICTRFASPAVAAAAVGLAALLHPLYQLTFLLHSEPLYMLLGTGAIYAALRVAEGRDRWVGLVVAILLSGAAVFTRDAGLFHFMLIGSAFAMGLRRGLPQGTWVRCVVGGVLCGVVMAGTFKLSRDARQLTAAEVVAIKNAGGMDATDLDEGSLDEAELEDVTGLAPEVQGHSNILASSRADTTIAQEQVARAGRAGKWFAWLLWHPLRFGDSVGAVGILGHITGWLTLSLLLVTLGFGIARRQWLWVGLGLYCAAFIFAWPQVNDRYLVPAAPLIVLGVLVALRHLAVGKFRWPARVMTGVFVLALLGVNGALYAVDVSIARSGDAYYEKFEAGDHQGLIASCKYLYDRGVDDGEVAVTVRYSNLGRSRESAYGLRAANLLLDANVIRVSKKDTRSGTSPAMRRRIRKDGAEWYLYQEPASPWRVWHFRLTPEQQAELTGEPISHPSGGWFLYQDVGQQRMRGTEVENPGTWPTRVPGL